MKTTKKILTFLFSLPLLLSATSAFAATVEPTAARWTATSKVEAKVLARNLKDSEGLVAKCYPGQNKIVFNVHDLIARRGTMVEYRTNNGQGMLVTKRNGIVSSADNDAATVQKFISDIARDYTLTFKVGNEEAVYSLVGSANTMRSLQGCGLPKPRASAR